jgi:hypothetical protein
MTITELELEQELAILTAEKCHDGEPACDVYQNTITLGNMDSLTEVFIATTLYPSLIPYICAKFMAIGYNIAEKRKLEELVK